MEKNLPNDPLEDFFRNNFKDAKAEPTTWDTPDDEVWEGIAAKVAPPKKVFRLPSSKNMILAVACGVALIFAALTWYYANENQQLKNQRAATKIIQEQTNSSTQKIEDELVINNDQSAAKQEEIANQQVSDSRGSDSGSSSSSSSDSGSGNSGGDRNRVPTDALSEGSNGNTQLAENSFTSTETEQFPISTSTVDANKNSSENIENQQSGNPSQQLSKLTVPEYLVQRSSFVFSNTTKTISGFTPNLTTPLAKSKNHWYLGTFAGNQWSQLEAVRPNGRKLPKNDNVDNLSTLAYNLRFGFQNSAGWNVGIGLGHQQIRQQRTEQTALVFRGIKRPNDEPEVYALQTSGELGSSTVEVRLAATNTPDPVINNTRVPIRITSQRQMSFLQIPLQVGYTKRWGALGIGLQTGPTLNFTTNTSLKISKVSSLDERLRISDKTSVRETKIATNPLYLTWSLSPNASYQLTDQWSVMVRSDLNYGINNVIDFPNRVGIRAQQAQVSAGVQFHF